MEVNGKFVSETEPAMSFVVNRIRFCSVTGLTGATGGEAGGEDELTDWHRRMLNAECRMLNDGFKPPFAHRSSFIVHRSSFIVRRLLCNLGLLRATRRFFES
jgi:hypothetical protein